MPWDPYPTFEEDSPKTEKNFLLLFFFLLTMVIHKHPNSSHVDLLTNVFCHVHFVFFLSLVYKFDAWPETKKNEFSMINWFWLSFFVVCYARRMGQALCCLFESMIVVMEIDDKFIFGQFTDSLCVFSYFFHVIFLYQEQQQKSTPNCVSLFLFSLLSLP